MNSISLRKLLALLAAFGLLAAACSTDDSDSDEEETDDTTEGEDSEGEENEGEDDVDDVELSFGAANPSCEAESDGVLNFGGLLPETGNLAFLGPPEFAGAELAAADINAAGGVLGEDVIWSPGDSSDNGDVANQTVDRHIEAGADVIVGAASSGVSFTVLEKITGECKIHFSPANTSPDFTTQDPAEMYFRAAPSDILQGKVLSDLIVEDGQETVAIMALQDPYGEGLLNFTKAPLEEAGVSVVTDFTYDPTAASFDAEVEQVTSEDPDAIVVIGFDETTQILTGLLEAGVENSQIYLVDGNMGNALGENFDAGQLTGIRGTIPTAELTDDFKDRLLEIDPELVDFTYGPETYDAMIITALAAEAAGTDAANEVAMQINDITREGTDCSTFAECKELIEAGEDVNYSGPSGPQEFSQPGEPTKASFAIKQFGESEIDESLTVYKQAEIAVG